MNIFVGSTALKHYIPSFKRKYASDIDVWTDDLEGTNSRWDVSCIPANIMDLFSEESKISGYATPGDVMTIKLSHLPYDIFWSKHSQDYLVLKMKYGYKVNEPLYSALKEHWKVVHGTKTHLSLYRTKDEFFDDYVEKQHDHDYLHELVAFPDVPVYTKVLKDGQEVLVDRNKFLELNHETQVKMFREEMNVIALERWVLNPATKGKIEFREAYSRSVKKTATALTKGWASEFICEHLEEFIKPNKEEVKYCLGVLGHNK